MKVNRRRTSISRRGVYQIRGQGCDSGLEECLLETPDGYRAPFKFLCQTIIAGSVFSTLSV